MKPKKPSKNIDVSTLEQQVADLTDALQRERADATNLRRRHEEQMSSLQTVVKANVIEQLLPIIDNFERSLKHVPTELSDNEYVKGVGRIIKQFEKTLGDMGVTRIETVDAPFDPLVHDAVSMDDSSEGQEEYVTEELQSGYRLGDNVIRHAMVRVARR